MDTLRTRAWILGIVFVAAATTGCTADVDDDDLDEDVVEVSSALDGPLPLLVRVKQGGGGRTVSRTFRYTYPRELRNTCGSDFSVTITARLGKVTSDKIKVNSVRAVFLPAKGESIVPTYLDVWSNRTDNKRVVDYDAFQKAFTYGQSHVWDVGLVVKTSKSGPATIQLPVGGLRGGDSSDLGCTYTATLQLLPR
jgi:hypothetical protein